MDINHTGMAASNVTPVTVLYQSNDVRSINKVQHHEKMLQMVSSTTSVKTLASKKRQPSIQKIPVS